MFNLLTLNADVSIGPWYAKKECVAIQGFWQDEVILPARNRSSHATDSVSRWLVCTQKQAGNWWCIVKCIYSERRPLEGRWVKAASNAHQLGKEDKKKLTGSSIKMICKHKATVQLLSCVCSHQHLHHLFRASQKSSAAVSEDEHQGLQLGSLSSVQICLIFCCCQGPWNAGVKERNPSGYMLCDRQATKISFDSWLMSNRSLKWIPKLHLLGRVRQWDLCVQQRVRPGDAPRPAVQLPPYAAHLHSRPSLLHHLQAIHTMVQCFNGRTPDGLLSQTAATCLHWVQFRLMRILG